MIRVGHGRIIWAASRAARTAGAGPWHWGNPIPREEPDAGAPAGPAAPLDPAGPRRRGPGSPGPVREVTSRCR